MSKKITMPEYTSPSEEELAEVLQKRDVAFISKVRRGQLDVFSLTLDGKKTRIAKRTLLRLQKRNFLNRSFALLNPTYFTRAEPNTPRIYFILLSADPDKYFDVKEWIWAAKDRFSFSAYTTIGQYDFIIRIVSPRSVLEGLVEELQKKFSLTEVVRADGSRDVLVLAVTSAVCYDRERKIMEPQEDISVLLPDRRRFVMAVNENIDLDKIGKETGAVYKKLRDANVILGTRTLVNTPKMHNILAFILAQYKNLEKVTRMLDDKKLNQNIIDVFTTSGHETYGALLVCEFQGRGSNALARYNKWMDDFYRIVKLPCLTFTADSTICEVPDVYETSTALKIVISKDWSATNGIPLGNGYWYKKDYEDLHAIMDHQALVYHTFLIGTSGSGKTNTCLHLAKSIPSKKVRVLLLSFKDAGSITEEDIHNCNGVKCSEEEFLAMKEWKHQNQPLLVINVGRDHLQIANHAIKLALEVPKTGTPQPLSYVLILDEFFTLNLPSDQLRPLVEQFLIPALSKCREQGVGIIITTVSFNNWEQVFDLCMNRFYHKISDNDAECRLVTTLPIIPGIGHEVTKEIQQLEQGCMICRVVNSQGLAIPPIAIKVPKLKA